MSAPVHPPLGPDDVVLFDMDGTLLFLPVDIEALRQRLTEYHQQYGLEMSFRPLTDDLGRAARKLRQLLPAAQSRAAILWARAQVSRAEEEAANQATTRDGVLGALRTLVERGVRVGVVSNNTRRGIRAAMREVGVEPDSLDVLVSREDVEQPKPSPDSLELAVRMLLRDGWEPAADSSRVVYVGDAPSDLIAARALDTGRLHPRMPALSVLIVGGGRAGSGSLAGPGADWVVGDDAAAREILVG